MLLLLRFTKNTIITLLHEFVISKDVGLADNHYSVLLPQMHYSDIIIAKATDNSHMQTTEHTTLRLFTKT